MFCWSVVCITVNIVAIIARQCGLEIAAVAKTFLFGKEVNLRSAVGGTDRLDVELLFARKG